jgi:hypothetical protein
MYSMCCQMLGAPSEEDLASVCDSRLVQEGTCAAFLLVVCA